MQYQEDFVKSTRQYSAHAIERHGRVAPCLRLKHYRCLGPKPVRKRKLQRQDTPQPISRIELRT
jgi:hypothetical protein